MKKSIIKGLSAILCASMVFLSACSTQTNDDTSNENENSAADSEQSYVTVSFDSNGGTEVKEVKIKKGDTLTLPEEPVKDGYVFCGWNTNPEAEAWVDTIDFSMYNIDADVTLHAIWGSEDYDLDEDGLSHKDEIAYSTDPCLYDTDKDGISDGDEVNKYHTEPSKDDTDGDTLLDGFEVAVGLDPLEKKSDGKTNDADRSISYTFSEADDGYSLTVDGNTKMLSSISTSTFDKSIADNTEEIISDIISIEKDSSDSFESADLVYSYKNDSLGSISEDNLTILYLNEDTGKYEAVSSVIDKAKKTISAKLFHFSKYTIGSLSLSNSNHLLTTKSITYNGKTINAVEVADSGFDLLKHSFSFHNFQTKDCPGGFCGGFSLVAYLNYIEKLPISAEKYSNLTVWNIPGYNISSSSRFVENNLYLEDEKDIFNSKNKYETDNVIMTDSTKEAVNCIEHWWGKQHGFADRFVSPDVATKNSYRKILKEKLQSGEPVPLTLYEWLDKTNVHSVLAYKMYETNDADYILVYDSNFPGEERYIKISNFFSIFTGAEYKMGSDSYPIVKISYVPIPDGPYVSHTAVAEEEPSTDIKISAEDLINKPVKEIVELMNGNIYTSEYPYSHGGNYFYNFDIFPGMKFYVFSDSYDNDSKEEFIQEVKNNNGFVFGIQVEESGAGFSYRNHLISVDMDYSQLTEIFGEMKCKRGTGALISGAWEGIAYTTETDNCKVTINFDVNWDVSKYLSEDIEVPESEMKEHNPKIKNIAIVTKPETSTATTDKSLAEVAQEVSPNKYWVVFREGYRDSRVEMSSFDVNGDFVVTWNKNLVCNNQNGECNQFYYNNSTFEKIGTYGILTDYATEIIASNFNIYDKDGNIVFNATTLISEPKSQHSEQSQPNNTEWKQLYIDAVKNNRVVSDYVYHSLVNVDNDGIPELVCQGNDVVHGTIIAWIKDGAVVYEHLGCSGVSYYPNENRFCASYVNHGIYRDTVYEFQNKSLVKLYEGEPISEENSSSSVFDKGRSASVKFFNRDEIINIINNY